MLRNALGTFWAYCVLHTTRLLKTVDHHHHHPSSLILNTLYQKRSSKLVALKNVSSFVSNSTTLDTLLCVGLRSFRTLQYLHTPCIYIFRPGGRSKKLGQLQHPQLVLEPAIIGGAKVLELANIGGAIAPPVPPALTLVKTTQPKLLYFQLSNENKTKIA